MDGYGQAACSLLTPHVCWEADMCMVDLRILITSETLRIHRHLYSMHIRSTRNRADNFFLMRLFVNVTNS